MLALLASTSSPVTVWVGLFGAAMMILTAGVVYVVFGGKKGASLTSYQATLIDAQEADLSMAKQKIEALTTQVALLVKQVDIQEAQIKALQGLHDLRVELNAGFERVNGKLDRLIK